MAFGVGHSIYRARKPAALARQHGHRGLGHPATPDRAPVAVDLALQGGGPHGAFTWGVLDRLLEETWLQFDGISGTSAGAMNAAVMVAGHAAGGAPTARAALAAFWRRVSDSARLSPFRRGPLDVLLGRWSWISRPTYIAMDFASRLFSPYDLNPGGTNPLREVLADSIDFAQLARAPIKLFITATNVHTGRGRVFRNAEVTPDVMLASACLPTMFQAVEIDGEAYWDGGYSGNPTLTPLVRECEASDTIHGADQPGRAAGHAALGARHPQSPQRDLVQLGDDQGAADDRAAAPGGRSRQRRGCGLGRHAHPPHPQRRAWPDSATSSKLNAEWEFLTMLRDRGRTAAQLFLDEHGDDLGKRSTLDFAKLLEGV